MDHEEEARRQEQTYQPDPTGTRLIPVGEEHHHDKNPVLMKVKDKVKKTKDTLHLRKHSHGDEHGRDNDRNTSEEGGDEEDDEENTPDPEVHGTPMYDTSAAQEFIAGQESKEPPREATLGNINAGLQEDPAEPKTEEHSAGDQSRATQPPPTRGGEEIETSPVIQSFEARAVSNQPQGEKEKEVKESTPPTGTHGQFTPAEADPRPTQEEDKPQGTEEPKGPSYTEKLSATAAAAKSAAAGSTEYGKKIASTVYEKVAEAGTAVKAKVQQKPSGTTGTEGGDAAAGQDKGVSVREYLAEKLRPGEEDKALSEMISEAFQKRKENAKEAAPEVTGSGGTGGGAGVVGRIRGAVAAFVWRGGSSRASPVSESTRTKGEEKRKESHEEQEGQK